MAAGRHLIDRPFGPPGLSADGLLSDVNVTTAGIHRPSEGGNSGFKKTKRKIQTAINKAHGIPTAIAAPSFSEFTELTVPRNNNIGVTNTRAPVMMIIIIKQPIGTIAVPEGLTASVREATSSSDSNALCSQQPKGAITHPPLMG